MRKLLGLAALAAFCGSAVAADLPIVTKAPQQVFATNSSGYWMGMYAAGAGGAADVKNIPGLNAASLTTTQGELGMEFGYRWASANSMKFVDVLVDVGYMNLNGSTAGLSLSGPIAVEAGVRVGVPAAAITSLFPALNFGNFPTVAPPTGTSVLATQTYVGALVRFEDISPNFGALKNTEWAISPGFMVGMIQVLNNGTAADFRFEYLGAANHCIGPFGSACATIDHRLMAKAVMNFM